MSPLELHLHKKLEERKDAGNLRRLKIPGAGVDFYSNDYLGWAASGIISEMVHSYGPLGTGSTGSRLLSGNSAEVEELEQTIAGFHDAEAALLFNSGYDANVGLLGAIADRHTTYIYDELCHASIIDGIRLSQAQAKYKYRHNDLHSLREKLERLTDKGNVIIVTESVFSMDGDMAPLRHITAIAAEYNAAVVVDEAHATGVFGKRGAGLVCEQGLSMQIFARIHTYGKALGCHGAAVVGSSLLKQYLVNFARPFIYTTALPAHAVKAISCAYQLLADPVFSNEPLHHLITYFRKQVAASGIKGCIDSHSPIQALVVGDNERTKHIASVLQQEGLQINPILSPTVPLGGERLRICLHSFNTTGQIDDLVAILGRI